MYKSIPKKLYTLDIYKKEDGISIWEVGNLAEAVDEYRKLFSLATIEDHKKLFKLHVLAYIIFNALWVGIFMTYGGSAPSWLMLYSIVGWGVIVILHYMIYVSGAEKRIKEMEECCLRECGMA